MTDRVHGVVFAGGSVFGLEATSGVRRYLAKQGIGYRTSSAMVPIVAGAILYDLSLGDASARPTREMGFQAAESASADPVKEGAVGAGTGATVGKLFGMARAMKSGVGSATVPLSGDLDGIHVAALAAVNSFGDVMDPETAKLIAGARTAEDSLDLAGTAAWMKSGAGSGRSGENTTLVVVATNARLTKGQSTKLAQLGSIGMARTIS